MSQYKAAMSRMLGGSDTDSQRPTVRPVVRPKQKTGNDLADYLVDNFDPLINFVIPVVWCLLFIVIMDRDGVYNYWYMPFLGLGAAILCNTVPIGGGVVYVPALSFLGVDMHLGVSFSVAVMTFGNGGLGFLRWLHKDSSLIIWESFRYTVLPSSVGTFLAMVFFPPLELSTVRTLFAYFCLVLSLLVLMAVYRGGSMDNLITTPQVNNSSSSTGTTTQAASLHDLSTNDSENTSLLVDTEAPSLADEVAEIVKLVDEIPIHFPESSSSSQSMSASPSAELRELPQLDVSMPHWYAIALVSFLAGALLVPNIGIGPALTTFIALQVVGYRPKAAIVTGIVTGGWVSIVPFLLHWLWLDDVPFQLWIMVLPGVFYGAKLAPLVHDYIGLPKVLSLFAVFLLGTAYLFLQ